jgi:hypothetical protein
MGNKFCFLSRRRKGVFWKGKTVFFLLRKIVVATKALRHKEKNFVFGLLRKKEISREDGKAFLGS